MLVQEVAKSRKQGVCVCGGPCVQVWVSLLREQTVLAASTDGRRWTFLADSGGAVHTLPQNTCAELLPRKKTVAAQLINSVIFETVTAYPKKLENENCNCIE